MFQQKPLLGRQIDWSHPLAKGLVECWLLNEGSGNKVYNSSGQGQHSSVFVSDVTWKPGKFGSALRFGGSADYVDLPWRSSTGIFTISVGINFASVLNQLIGLHDGTRRAYLGVTNQGLCYFAVGDSSVASGASGVVYGSWSNIIISCDGTDAKYYFNSVHLATISGYSWTGTAASDFRLGETSGGAAALSAGTLIDSVQIYNRALSASEAAQLSREPFCMFERDPIELWHAAQVAAAGAVPQLQMLRQLWAA